MFSSSRLLLQFHCDSNTGYAIGPLEQLFHKMALRVTGNEDRVCYSYSSLAGGHPRHLASSLKRVFEIDPGERDPNVLARYSELIKQNDIEIVFAFDLPLRAPILRAYRNAGVHTIISYWGASISSPYPWYIRPLRRIQYWLSFGKPDHFIFESEGMRDGAIHGALIPESRTSVCHIGVDMKRFADSVAPSDYAYKEFNIPSDRKIIFFSGHMEQRKGVAVLVRAIVELVVNRGRRDVHLLITGNKPGEEAPFIPIIANSIASDHVTFGGYRSDIPKLHRSVYAGVIASTGWDSFTISAVEMAASGIPLVISRLPGLEEAVIDGVTGYLFPPGDYLALASRISDLLYQPSVRDLMGKAARQRVAEQFTTERQLDTLVQTVTSVLRP